MHFAPLRFAFRLVLGGVACVAVPSQTQFGPDARQCLPIDLSGEQWQFHDLDGDGDLDLCGVCFVASGNQLSLVVCSNDGHGNFGAAQLTALGSGLSGAVTGLAAGDVDGDGDVDVVIGRSLVLNSMGRTLLLRNDGTGRFTPSTTLPDDTALGSGGLVLFDCDGDQDLDLFLCGSPASPNATPNRLLVNDGSGTFTPSVLPLPQSGWPASAPVAGDLDGDGDLDLCILGASAPLPPTSGGATLYRNDGPLGFTDVTATQMPWSFGRFGLGQVLFDADGDGDLDLAVASPGISGGADVLALNDGSGRFQSATGFPATAQPGTRMLLPFDCDNDGDLDLFVARVDSSYLNGDRPAVDQLWQNDGTGQFTDATAAWLPDLATYSSCAACGDLDGDGDVDVVVGEGMRMQYLRHTSTGFVDDSLHRVPSELRGGRPLLADLDGDGDLDLVVTGGHSPTLCTARNDGDGRFVFAGRTAVAAYGFATGDFDGDHRADVVVLVNGQDRLLFGDGLGGFVDVTAARLPVETGATVGLLVFDADGDGDLDLLRADQDVIAQTTLLTLLRNDGTGSFAVVPGAVAAVDAVPVLAVDVDGDGDLDVLAASPWIERGLFPPHLLLNQAGSFVDAGATRFPPLATESIQSFAAGDIDGDGDVDIVLGAAFPPASGYGQNHLGGGVFVDVTATALPVELRGTTALALVDIDEDGDLDLLEAARADSSVHPGVRLNDGQGRFGIPPVPRIDASSPLEDELCVGDLDGDGDLDLVVDGPQVLINRHRQISAPFAAQSGGSLTLRAWVEPGYGPGQAPVWFYYAVRRATLPIPLPPFGDFRLDPGHLCFAPQATTNGGVLDLVLAVPPDPALLGFTLQVQAMHGNRSGPRLGNAISEKVVL